MPPSHYHILLLMLRETNLPICAQWNCGNSAAVLLCTHGVAWCNGLFILCAKVGAKCTMVLYVMHDQTCLILSVSVHRACWAGLL